MAIKHICKYVYDIHIFSKLERKSFAFARFKTSNFSVEKDTERLQGTKGLFRMESGISKLQEDKKVR